MRHKETLGGIAGKNVLEIRMVSLMAAELRVIRERNMEWRRHPLNRQRLAVHHELEHGRHENRHRHLRQ